MHSRIYKGWVEHRRFAPHPHAFRYRLFMLYIDLDELPRLFDRTPFWSARRPAPAWFKRGDYLGPPELPLDAAVRALVFERTGRRPTGPIRLLTHLRYFGYCMNPVSFYYCFDDAGDTVQTIVAEITNTPWKERHQYVLQVDAAHRRLKRFDFDKRFHVSPFMPMDLRYRWCFTEPDRRLFVNMRNFQDVAQIFDATLSLRGRPVTPAGLVLSLCGYPFMTLRVIASIHWQALKLWLKRTPFYGHPAGLSDSGPSTAAGGTPVQVGASAGCMVPLCTPPSRRSGLAPPRDDVPECDRVTESSIDKGAA